MTFSGRLARRALTAAPLTCVAALATACGASSAPPVRRAAPAGADTFIAAGQDISGIALREPACHSGCVLSGDGTSILYNMTWSNWTGTGAAGAGTENIEDCVPNCASGGQYRVPVVVTFSRPVQDCAAGSGTANTVPAGPRWFWSQVSFTYPKGLPKALQGTSAPQNPWKFTPLIAQAQQSCG